MAKKWREAIALYEKVTEYAEEAIGKFKRYTGDQKEAKVEQNSVWSICLIHVWRSL